MQLHFLQERKESLEKAKFSPIREFLAVLLSLAFVANAIVNLIAACIEHGNELIASDITLFFGRHIEPISAYLVIIGLALLLLCELGKNLDITGWEPITSIPVWVLAFDGLIILATVYSLTGGQYAIGVSTSMSVLFFILADSRRKRNKQVRLRAQRALQAKSKPEQWAGPTRVEHCEVCHKESQYDLCLECYKQYRGERQRVKAQILRAKQAGVAATLTLGEWIETLNTFHWRCAYCHGPFECLEHYVPVVEGGGTTQDNCVPSCHSCNSTKSVKHPEK